MNDDDVDDNYNENWNQAVEIFEKFQTKRT